MDTTEDSVYVPQSGVPIINSCSEPSAEVTMALDGNRAVTL